LARTPRRRISQLADKRIEVKTALANLMANGTEFWGGTTGEDTEGVAVFEGSVEVSNEGGRGCALRQGPHAVPRPLPSLGHAFKIIHRPHRHDAAHPRPRPESGGHVAAGEDGSRRGCGHLQKRDSS